MVSDNLFAAHFICQSRWVLRPPEVLPASFLCDSRCSKGEDDISVLSWFTHVLPQIRNRYVPPMHCIGILFLGKLTNISLKSALWNKKLKIHFPICLSSSLSCGEKEYKNCGQNLKLEKYHFCPSYPHPVI